MTEIFTSDARASSDARPRTLGVGPTRYGAGARDAGRILVEHLYAARLTLDKKFNK